MPAPKGNKFWKARSKHGRDAIFNSPAVMEDAIKEYFEQASDDFLVETKPHAYEGSITYSETNKMVPFTLGKLCLFLNMTDETWREYRKKDDFSGVCAWAEKVIYEQKFAGAASGFLNPAIIARDLGLKDNTDITSNGEAIITQVVLTGKNDES